MFSRVFIAEEVGGVADKVLGDNYNGLYTDSLVDIFNMSPRSTCFIDKTFFLVKIKTPGLGSTLCKYQEICSSE